MMLIWLCCSRSNERWELRCSWSCACIALSHAHSSTSWALWLILDFGHFVQLKVLDDGTLFGLWICLKSLIWYLLLLYCRMSFLEFQSSFLICLLLISYIGFCSLECRWWWTLLLFFRFFIWIFSILGHLVHLFTSSRILLVLVFFITGIYRRRVILVPELLVLVSSLIEAFCSLLLIALLVRACRGWTWTTAIIGIASIWCDQVVWNMTQLLLRLRSLFANLPLLHQNQRLWVGCSSFGCFRLALFFHINTNIKLWMHALVFTLKVLLKWEVGLGEIYLEILFFISISFLADISPAYLVEERMLLDGFDSTNFTESLRGILLQETLDQAQRVAREMGDAKVRRDDIFLHLNLVVVVVWWKTCDQLVQQHSQAVKVQGPAVMLFI